MSNLSDRITEAIKYKKNILLNYDNGDSYNLGNSGKLIEGNGSDYIEVVNGSSSVLYNLNKTKSIKID